MMSSEYSYIEGIGNEMVETFIILLLLSIVYLAWYSTRTTNRITMETLYVIEHRRLPENTTPVASDNISSQTQDAVESITDTDEQLIDEVPFENQTANDANDIIERMDREVEVRRRRNVTNAYNVVPRSISEDNTENENIANEQEANARVGQDKTPEGQSEQITVKLMYLNDNVKIVQAKLNDRLGDFKRLHFQNELAESKLVKLIFNGRILQGDSNTLEGCGLFDNCVVHCLIRQSQTGEGAASPPINNPYVYSEQTSPRLPRGIYRRTTPIVHEEETQTVDLGNLLYVMLGAIFLIAWYVRYYHGQFFTTTTNIGLICLSGLFGMFVIRVQGERNNRTTTSNNTATQSSTNSSNGFPLNS